MASLIRTTLSDVISVGELYPLDEAARRLGWSRRAMRTARRAGLPVRYFGGRGFLIGDDVIAFIREHGSKEYR